MLLASASPRRAELLRMAGYDFAIAVADVEEVPRRGERSVDYGARVALDKARAVVRAGHVCLAADTEVVLGRRIFGKPANAADAAAMLATLSDRWHRVQTSVALIAEQQTVQFTVSTRVRFRALSAAEIAGYVATGEAQGKAGAYAIQGHAALFVAALRGPYSNVVGLPLFEVGRALTGLGVQPRWSQRIDSAGAASL
ncbi:MAG: septum formation protein Maf [Xanthomonadales bacterium]|nr:septum formation protein Maf [Xanthomonadales bacterium]